MFCYFLSYHVSITFSQMIPKRYCSVPERYKFRTIGIIFRANRVDDFASKCYDVNVKRCYRKATVRLIISCY